MKFYSIFDAGGDRAIGTCVHGAPRPCAHLKRAQQGLLDALTYGATNRLVRRMCCRVLCCAGHERGEEMDLSVDSTDTYGSEVHYASGHTRTASDADEQEGSA